MTTHRYSTALRWSGSTAVGYEGYSRQHHLVVGPEALAASADHAFLGDPARVNPEQLLLAAASSCQLLSFLAVAARARVDVVDYTDHASAVMPEDEPPLRVAAITLRPRITVTGAPPRAKVERLVEVDDELDGVVDHRDDVREGVTEEPRDADGDVDARTPELLEADRFEPDDAA